MGILRLKFLDHLACPEKQSDAGTALVMTGAKNAVAAVLK